MEFTLYVEFIIVCTARISWTSSLYLALVIGYNNRDHDRLIEQVKAV